MATRMNSDFQAIVLTGSGRRLYTLTEHVGYPKSLLPIANKPLLHNVLMWLIANNITDIIVLTKGKGGNRAISNSVKSFQQTIGSIAQITILNSEIGHGTAKSLRSISGRLYSDFIVVKEDIVTDISLTPFFEKHRIIQPSVSCLFLEGSSDVEKAKDDTPVVLDETRERLIMLIKETECSDLLSINSTLLFKYPHMKIYKNLNDSRIYIFKRSIIELIEKYSINSIKEDLVPLLTKLQFTKSYGPCIVHIVDQGFCIRANNIPTYVQCNRIMVQKLTQIESRISPTSDIDKKSQVGADTIVGERTVIMANCSIKRSIIGPNCQIHENTKIANSIVMSNVTIKSNNKIDNAIICSFATLEKSCTLSNCEVGFHAQVDSNTVAKNQSFFVNEISTTQ